MAYNRYAIFFTLPDGPLADLAADWLGWHAAAGEPRRHPELAGLTRDVEKITEAPRRYGFHGTIKPPFRLAAGANADDLSAAVVAFCGAESPVVLDGVALGRIGNFLALRPVGATGALDRLAAETVVRLDPFRAPPDLSELERRRAARLTRRQEAMLQRWGYPYVMEDFRFHMTLTGALREPDLAATESALEAYLAPALPAPLAMDALSLMGEDVTGRFHQLSRIALTG
jgi:putative phosphonate metabolism protein